MLISDVGGEDGKSFIFSDLEINTFLESRGSVNLAAAAALRTIAANEAQVSKRIKFLELSTDGPAVAKELRALAQELEEQDDDDSDMEIATMGVDLFSRRSLSGREYI
jgi:hypothetical protein